MMYLRPLFTLLTVLSLTTALKFAPRQDSETSFEPITPCRINDAVANGAGYCGGACYEAQVTCTADGKYVESD